VRDVNNLYNWSEPGSLDLNGTAFSEFLATLNDPRGRFANHCDWRLPSIDELKAIVDPTQGHCDDYGPSPLIDPIFGRTQGRVAVRRRN
jgi:hypothetical protein